MADPVQEYKKFIDGLLGWPRTSVLARWVREWDAGDKTYRVPPDNPLHRLVPALSAEQREALA